MRWPIYSAALALMAVAMTWGYAQAPQSRPGDLNLPAPGTRGNPDNVPFIRRNFQTVVLLIIAVSLIPAALQILRARSASRASTATAP